METPPKEAVDRGAEAKEGGGRKKERRKKEPTLDPKGCNPALILSPPTKAVQSI